MVGCRLNGGENATSCLQINHPKWRPRRWSLTYSSGLCPMPSEFQFRWNLKNLVKKNFFSPASGLLVKQHRKRLLIQSYVYSDQECLLELFLYQCACMRTHIGNAEGRRNSMWWPIAHAKYFIPNSEMKNRSKEEDSNFTSPKRIRKETKRGMWRSKLWKQRPSEAALSYHSCAFGTLRKGAGTHGNIRNLCSHPTSTYTNATTRKVNLYFKTEEVWRDTLTGGPFLYHLPPSKSSSRTEALKQQGNCSGKVVLFLKRQNSLEAKKPGDATGVCPSLTAILGPVQLSLWKWFSFPPTWIISPSLWRLLLHSVEDAWSPAVHN